MNGWPFVLPGSHTLMSCFALFSAGALYSHTAAKLVFVRLFRHSRHVYSHTILGWVVWVSLCFAAVAVAFILAVAVPIFSYLIGIAAALFASWYTYGLAGFFWLYDAYYPHGGARALRTRWIGTTLAVLTIVAGAFICVAGTYVSVEVRSLLRIILWDSVLITGHFRNMQLIVVAYRSDIVERPFTC